VPQDEEFGTGQPYLPAGMYRSVNHREMQRPRKQNLKVSLKSPSSAFSEAQLHVLLLLLRAVHLYFEFC
jgi:hypothetical protein